MPQESLSRKTVHNEELIASDHELITNYRPEFIANGNEHFVYSIPDHPDIVVKVNKFSILANIDWCKINEASLEDYMNNSEVNETVEGRIKESNEGLSMLKKYFGKERLPDSRYVKIKVPVFPSMLRGTNLEGDETLSEAYAVALVQSKIDGFEEKESLHTWYAKSESADEYLRNTLSCLFPEEENIYPNHNTAQENQEYESRTEAVRDFVIKAIKYSNETGKILDLAGQGNVLLQDKDGKHDYMLVDALFPATWEDSLDEIRSDFIKYINNSDEFSVNNRSQRILLTLNYVRYINEIAESVGVLDRIVVTPDKSKLTKEKITELISRSIDLYKSR